MEQFFGLVNTFLRNHRDTWKRRLVIRTYKVLSHFFYNNDEILDHTCLAEGLFSMWNRRIGFIAIILKAWFKL